ncbi:hypothetical protein EZV62_006267 [Acer yangbiense]|uniref:Chromo domain-containing protein n=1 Tax=Acer yangbiense TaxID=1000413 RepID=A0A5C7ISI1_9ROSI|nr:hypothetical protein EZV62_006267 [Acer yangbiense]
MVSDTEVATRGEEQGRGREEQRTQPKRGKSKGPSMDALESRMVGLEEAISGMQTTLGDAVDRLDGLEADYGEITQATKSTIRESQKGFKEDVCFLTQEFRNFRTFVEHELRALRTEVEEVRPEWASYKSSPTVAYGATSSTSTLSAIQVPKPATYNGTRNAMEVENFLFGLEQYFEAKGARDDATKIANAPTFPPSFAMPPNYGGDEKKANQGKSGGDKSGQRSQCRKEEGQRKPSNTDKRNKPSGGKSEAPKPKSPCFICDGPHWVRDCPKRKTLSAMMSQHEESQDRGYEAGMGSLRQLGALKSNNAPSTSTKKGLMFVNASINGKAVRAMLDTGATHNFVSVDEAKTLGLQTTNRGGTIKAVNSPAKSIAGIAKAVPVCLGTWSGKLDFSVVPMDDFQLVLGMEFFDQVHAFPFPAGNSLSILDGSKTCMVPAERMAKVESRVLSALQFKRGLKKDPSFLATLRELNDGEDSLVPKDPMPAKVQAILNEYKDVMPQELPKKLPPRREAWQWSDKCHQAFEELKRAISKEPVLILPDHTKSFELHTDASDFTIGGVLMQDGHPIAFESRKLNDTERPTSRRRRSLAPSKQARWQDFLAEFDYRLEYKPGKANVVADALSRKAELAAMNISQPQSTLVSRIKEGLQQDPLAKSLKKLANEGKTRHFWLVEEVLLTTGNRMYVPKWGNLRKEIIKECHDSKWAGHPGMTRTLALLQNSYYWPQMRDDVDAYVRTCLVCQQDKVEQQRPAGLLEPLPIAGRPWESVSMDFISALLKFEGCGSIMVVIDRFSKYATFILAPKDCTAEEAARLFLKHVVKLWEVPQNIVSDRDPRFTGRFWTELFKMLGTNLNFSTSFHPQSDGQTERFNGLLELYLRHYVSTHQRDWAKLLDVAQFSFNLQRSEATGNSPFEIVMGQQPMTPNAIASTYGGKSPAAYKLAREWHEQADITRACLDKAARKMKKWADTRRRHIEFNEGDLVLVKLLPQQFKSLRQVHKGLVRKYEGPFPIIKRVGKVSYQVQLPPRLKIHPVFHVSFLKPYHADMEDPRRSESKRAPTAVVTAFDKEVECILADRVIQRRGVPNYIEYLVKWKDLPDSEASWERGDTLWQFDEHIQRYKDEDATRTPRA